MQHPVHVVPTQTVEPPPLSTHHRSSRYMSLAVLCSPFQSNEGNLTGPHPLFHSVGLLVTSQFSFTADMFLLLSTVCTHVYVYLFSSLLALQNNMPIHNQRMSVHFSACELCSTCPKDEIYCNIVVAHCYTHCRSLTAEEGLHGRIILFH